MSKVSRVDSDVMSPIDLAIDRDCTRYTCPIQNCLAANSYKAEACKFEIDAYEKCTAAVRASFASAGAANATASPAPTALTTIKGTSATKSKSTH